MVTLAREEQGKKGSRTSGDVANILFLHLVTNGENSLSCIPKDVSIIPLCIIVHKTKQNCTTNQTNTSPLPTFPKEQ